MKKMNKKGFTIVELVIVIAVIAILAAVLIPTFATVISKANYNAALQKARNAYTEVKAATTADLSKLGTQTITETFNGTPDLADDTYKLSTEELKDVKAALTDAGVEGVSYASATDTFTVKVNDSYTFTFKDGTWTKN